MTTTPPTRRQLWQMREEQRKAWAANNAPRSCRESFCRCIVCPFSKPAPSAGTCISPSQGAEDE